MENYWQRENTVNHGITEWRIVLACCIMLITGIYIFETQRIKTYNNVIISVGVAEVVAPVIVPVISMVR